MHTFEHLCSLALLVSFPLVFLCVYAGSGSLWWLPGMHDAHSLAGLRSAVLGLSLVLFTAGLEGRVVFHGFGEYVRVPAPWSYALVTAALYGSLAAAAAAVTGAVGVRGGVPTAAVGAVLVMASCAAALAVGAPAWLLPAAAASAWGVSRFYGAALCPGRQRSHARFTSFPISTRVIRPFRSAAKKDFKGFSKKNEKKCMPMRPGARVVHASEP